MRWKITPATPKPKGGDVRAVKRFAFWPQMTETGWTVWLERYWAIQAWAEHADGISSDYRWATFGRFTTDNLDAHDIDRVLRDNGLSAPSSLADLMTEGKT